MTNPAPQHDAPTGTSGAAAAAPRLSVSVRSQLLVRVVAAGMLAGLLLSPNLWLTTRTYPLTPVADWLPPIPPPFDVVWFVALLAQLAVVLVWPLSRVPVLVFVVSAAALSLWDQSRWQPWF